MLRGGSRAAAALCAVEHPRADRPEARPQRPLRV